ncbi:MAG TPA: response regulator transcription factor [Sumerlaeia bacterium]|nr:response regulator transcription factor [Sumerlaeia bacterium]
MAAAATHARILLVDDEAYFCQFLTNLFREEPVQVVSRTYGAEAVDLLEHESFDLIIIDYQLPDMLGTDLLAWIGAREIAAPCVMVTAYGTIDLAVEAMKAGAVDFFTKPLQNPSAFVRFLSRILFREPTAARGKGGESPPRPEAAESAFLSETVRFAGRVASARERCARLDPPVALSRREYEVLAALLRGFANKEIASALYISERTVKNHLTHIYRKFGVSGRSQLFNRLLVDGA